MQAGGWEGYRVGARPFPAHPSRKDVRWNRAVCTQSDPDNTFFFYSCPLSVGPVLSSREGKVIVQPESQAAMSIQHRMNQISRTYQHEAHGRGSE